MTTERRYLLEIDVDDEAEMQQIEDLLKELLTELYAHDDVDSVRVTKDGRPDTKDVEELVKIIDGVETDHIRRAIDLINKLEEPNDG